MEGSANQGEYLSSSLTGANDSNLPNLDYTTQPERQQHDDEARSYFTQTGFTEPLSLGIADSFGNPYDESQVPIPYQQSVESNPFWLQEEDGMWDFDDTTSHSGYMQPPPPSCPGPSSDKNAEGGVTDNGLSISVGTGNYSGDRRGSINSDASFGYQQPFPADYGQHLAADPNITAYCERPENPRLVGSNSGSFTFEHNGFSRGTQLRQLHAEPWTPLHPAFDNQQPEHVGHLEVFSPQNQSETPHDMSVYDDSDSYAVISTNIATPVSSATDPRNAFAHENQQTFSIRDTFYHQAEHDAENLAPEPMSQHNISFHLQRAPTPAFTAPDLIGYTHSDPSHGLTVPDYPTEFSAPSLTTEASSSVSNYIPDPLRCNMIGCNVAFNGKHRKGNLARHRKSVHGVDKRYECLERSCSKVFKRSDARRKHYKKYHPWLAANSSLSSRSNGSRSASGNQEDDFNHMAAWSTYNHP
ncbi:hypothetical protein TW65_01526 [Stemphylium lycopersici]|uniref:C2H2-type domain-containing protein n=1 Tax=Stemphylium lycopersici TaxID=183478 RepID=A0A364MST8_STELY|nr:hypothetical protein TW65_01526 [Stemphylium lycopersici]RAR02389.1 hypothetical protein DDE83_008579 [Stemphylium lycopersici]